ncbi:MAG: ROK family transcriptional regulator [Chloroflexota bacterium]
MLQPNPAASKATTSQLKKHNESLILREIYAHDTISRVRLAQLTHLSRPSVTEITQGLLEKGLILELGPESVQDKVGKKPTLLALNPDAYQIIGIVLTDTTALGTLLDLRMKTISQQIVPIQDLTSQRLINRLIGLIDVIRQQATYPLLGITVGIPGIINSETGFVHLTTYFEWENIPLGEILAERFQLPVYVGNDSNLAAVGEYRYGHGQDIKNLVVVEAGEGLGAGILADGRIIGGHSLAAGEIGHMPIPQLDDICICGRRGCLETMVSWWGIKRHAQILAQTYPDSPLAQLTQEGCEISVATIKKAIAQGDTHLLELVEQVATYLGGALIMLIHLLNPKMIIITGSILELGESFVAEVRKTVIDATHPYTVGDLEIIANRFDNQSILLGAGAFLLEQELGL